MENYYQTLKPLAKIGKLDLPVIPTYLEHNAHIFYIKLKDVKQRITFNKHMQAANILSVFHTMLFYTLAQLVINFVVFMVTIVIQTKESDRLIRLPIFYNLTKKKQQQVIN